MTKMTSKCHQNDAQDEDEDEVYDEEKHVGEFGGGDDDDDEDSDGAAAAAADGGARGADGERGASLREMPLEELQAEAKRVGITDREIGKSDEDAASQDTLVDKILQREEEQVCRKRPRREVPTLPLRPARGPRPSRGASGRPRAQNRFFLCWACFVPRIRLLRCRQAGFAVSRAGCGRSH